MYSDKWDIKKQNKKFKKSFTNNAKLIIKRFYDKSGIENILDTGKIDGIIISGSDYFILNKDSPRIPKFVFNYKIPILAICYGLQNLTAKKNIGSFKCGMKKYTKKIKISRPFKVKKLKYTFYHQDYLVNINKKYKIIKKMGNKIIIAYNKLDNIIGIQFHPEYDKKTGKIFFKKWLNFIRK
jgi:GMP synthase (glutamine-hydrolysing)